MTHSPKSSSRRLVGLLGGASLAALSITAPALAQTLSGAQTVTQTFSAADLNVATDATFSVTTLSGNGIDLTSTNSLTFTDNYQSVINGSYSGIYADNSGTGALSITSTGTVTGAGGDGIAATNFGTDLTVTANNATANYSGIYANNSGTGALSITSTGTLTSNGDGIYGYNAGSNFTVTANNVTGSRFGIYLANFGTNLTVTANNVTGAGYGIAAVSVGTGALSINSTGTATATNGHGILALNYIFGTNLTVTSNNATGFGSGINATNYGTGALSITSTGTVTATAVNGYGILAQNYGSGALSITSTGTVSATGTNGYGIYAVNKTRAISLTVSGTVTGGSYSDGYGDAAAGVDAVAGIYVDSSSGSNAINLLSTAVVNSASGRAITASGNTTITFNAGSVVTGAVGFNGNLALNTLTGSAQTLTRLIELSSDIVGLPDYVVGTVTKSGAGTLTLTGANTYTGGTTISAGTLQIGSGGTSGSIAGNVSNDGTLAFNRSDALTFAGIVSGTGTVTKSGAGTLTLTGANTYTGGTTVAGGTLAVTGKIGAVTVTSGTLQGTGTVGTTTIASGSTLSPGINGAPGTLNVSGNLTMLAGANYAVAVTPTAASKAIVSGSANINGAVTATFAAGNYTVGQKFAIVESTGLVTGSFASLTHAGAALPVYLTDNLSYTSNSVYLNLATKNLTPLLPTGSASNLTNTAKAIDGFVTAGGIPNTGMLALYSQTGAALADSITQAEGQVGTNVATAVSQSFAPFLKTMTDQCATGSDQDASASCVWSSVYGGHTGISADVTTGAASLSGSNVGLAVGGQINIPEINSVLAASMAIGQQSFSSGNGTGTSRDILLGIYAHKTIMDHGYVSASLGYGNLDVTTTRTVRVAGTDVLSGNVTANEFGGRIEGGYRFNVEDQFGLTPYLAGSLQNINTPAYAESVQRGTSSYTLSYLSQNNTLSHFEAGTHLDRSFQLDDDTNLTAQGTIGWSHQLGYNPTSTVSFQSLIGSSFKLSGIKPANDMAVIGLNLQAQKATGLSFGVRLDSQVGSGTTILQGTGNVAYRW